jgi:hypothetical protein
MRPNRGKGGAREEGRDDRWDRRVSIREEKEKGRKGKWAAGGGLGRKRRQAGRKLGRGGLKGERGDVESFPFLNLFKLKPFKFFSKYSKSF